MKSIFIVLISSFIILGCLIQTQTVSQHTIYKPSNTQIILQQHQDQIFGAKLFLIEDQGNRKLKRVYYNKNTNQINVYTFNFTGDMYALKAHDPIAFMSVVISNRQQTNYYVYLFYTNTEAITINNFPYEEIWSYQIDSKFIPPKGSLNTIRVFDGFQVFINNKIIHNQGTQAYQTMQSDQILGITQNLKFQFTKNAVYQFDYLKYNYLFSINISSEYKCQLFFYKKQWYEGTDFKQYQLKFIFFCYKFSIDKNLPVYDWIVNAYVKSTKYPKGIKIDEVKGKTLQIPIFKVSKKLQKFMVAGRNLDASSLMLIKNINIIDLIFQDIAIPTTINIQIMDIELTDWHLYVRSKIKLNQRYKYQIYLIIATQCILIESSYLNSSQYQNLISTSIYYPQHIQQFKYDRGLIPPAFPFTLQQQQSPIETSKLKLIHYYKNQNDYVIEFKQFQTIKELQIQENSNGLLFFRDTNGNYNSIEIKKDIGQTKIIYAYQPDQTSTTFVLESFLLNVKASITIDGKFKIGKISQGKSNCILATDQSNNNILASILFNEEQKKLQLIQLHDYNQNIFSQVMNVRTNCHGFWLSRWQIWRRKINSNTSPIYQKDQQLPKLYKQKRDYWYLYDLRYVIQFQSESNNYLYYYNNQTKLYQKTLKNQSIGIFNYQFNTFDFNADSTKLLLVAFKQTSTTQGTTYYRYRPIIIYKSSTQWKSIQNLQEVITTSSYFQKFVSEDLQTVIFYYYSGQIKKYIVYNINYQQNIAKTITNTSKILTQEYPVQYEIYIYAGNNYLYLRNLTHQFMLKLSKQKQKLGYNEIVMQNKIDLDIYWKWQPVIIAQNINKQQVSLIYYNAFQIDVLNYRYKDNNNVFNERIRTDLRAIIYDSQTDKIYQCLPGCQFCFRKNLCRKCKDGYYLAYQMNICLRCQENCKTCTYSRPDICLSCFPKYVLEGSICKKCHFNCFQCSLTSQNKCTSCSIDRTLVSQSKINKTCIECPGNCSYCQQSTKCKQCETGFTVDTSGKCISCPLTCNKCNSSALSSCLQCKIGYYMQKAQNFYQNITCNRCSNNCKLCRSSTQCYQCINLYRLQQIQLPQNKFKVICVAKCELPCRQCNQNNATQCLNCVEGYVYNKTSKSCDFDLSCNLFQNCTLCPYEYNLISNKCYACKTHQNCDSCYRYNFSKCLSCKKGYYLSQNECVSCSAQCQECIIQNVCTKCKAGYLLQHDIPASQCIPCSTNCKTCLFTPANCITCNQNMQIYGSRCISSIKIVLNITLNYDYNSFKNADYVGITNQICKKTGKTREQVTIKSIKAGSVNLAGDILVQNLQDQTNTLNVLRGQFAQGSSVDGKTIISSSYTGSLTQPVVSNSGVNLKLILGIVIPISVVFIALIVFIIYRVRKAALEQNLKRAEAQQSTQSGASQKERTKRRNQRAAKRKMKNLPDSRSYVTTASSSSKQIDRNPQQQMENV